MTEQNQKGSSKLLEKVQYGLFGAAVLILVGVLSVCVLGVALGLLYVMLV